MGQYVLSVLQTLCHLGVVAVKSLVERHSRSLTLFVDVCHISILRVKQDFCVILEVNLNDLVTESEHYCVLGSHPFLNINASWWVLKLVGLVQEVSLNELLLFLRIIVLLKV